MSEEYGIQFLAELVQGEVFGDTELVVSGISNMVMARDGDLCFCNSVDKYREDLEKTQASVILVQSHQEWLNKSQIVVFDPRLAFSVISGYLTQNRKFDVGIHETAVVSPKATLGKGVGVGPYAVINEGVIIGDGTYIGSHSYIGSDSRIGKDSYLFSNVQVYSGTSIGDRCIIHSSVVIGGDGLGFSFAKDSNTWVKMEHVGHVCIGSDVEIGALTNIDRGAVGETLIGDGVKIDSHVHIAHNCQIGDHTLLCARTAIAGSSIVGHHSVLGGCVAVADHITIGNCVRIQGGAMVTKGIKDHSIIAGAFPAMPVKKWNKLVSGIRRFFIKQ